MWFVRLLFGLLCLGFGGCLGYLVVFFGWPFLWYPDSIPGWAAFGLPYQGWQAYLVLGVMAALAGLSLFGGYLMLSKFFRRPHRA